MKCVCEADARRIWNEGGNLVLTPRDDGSFWFDTTNSFERRIDATFDALIESYEELACNALHGHHCIFWVEG